MTVKPAKECCIPLCPHACLRVHHAGPEPQPHCLGFFFCLGPSILSMEDVLSGASADWVFVYSRLSPCCTAVSTGHGSGKHLQTDMCAAQHALKQDAIPRCRHAQEGQGLQRFAVEAGTCRAIIPSSEVALCALTVLLPGAGNTML